MLVPVAVAVVVPVPVLVAGGLMIHGVRQRVDVPVAVEVAVVVDVAVGGGDGGRTVEVPVVLGGVPVLVAVAVAVDVLGGRAVVVAGGGVAVVVAGGGVTSPGTSVPSGGMSPGSVVGSSVTEGCTPSASMVEGGANVRMGGVSPSSVPLDAPRA